MKAYVIRHTESSCCDFAIEAESSQDALEKFRNVLDANVDYIYDVFCGVDVEGEQQVLYTDPNDVTQDCYISEDKYQELIRG